METPPTCLQTAAFLWHNSPSQMLFILFFIKKIVAHKKNNERKITEHYWKNYWNILHRFGVITEKY